MLLAKPCQECHKPMNGGVYRKALVCPHCGFDHDEGRAKRGRGSPVASIDAKRAKDRKPASGGKAAANPLQPAEVKLVTKPVEQTQMIAADLGDVKSEGLAAVKVTSDMFENGKFVGTKNKTVQEAFARAKKEALTELRHQAAVMGANTVAEIAIKNSMKGHDSKNAKLIVRVSGKALMLEASGRTESA